MKKSLLAGSLLALAAGLILAAEPGEAFRLLPPEERLQRLSRELGLTALQSRRVLAVLQATDVAVRKAESDGQAAIRRLLTEGQQEIFDDLRTDAVEQTLKPVVQPRLAPMSGSGGQDARGKRGGSGRGGRTQGLGGRRSGHGQTGEGAVPTRGAGQGPGGAVPGDSDRGAGQGRCGDGVCGPVERSRGICPADCGTSEGGE